MNIYLNCPYSKRHVAKQHGARWDAARKQWFFAGAELPEPLKQFSLAHNRTMTLRCQCFRIGTAGLYPFSTLPDSGRCDDCV